MTLVIMELPGSKNFGVVQETGEPVMVIRSSDFMSAKLAERYKNIIVSHVPPNDERHKLAEEAEAYRQLVFEYNRTEKVNIDNWNAMTNQEGPADEGSEEQVETETKEEGNDEEKGRQSEGGEDEIAHGQQHEEKGGDSEGSRKSNEDDGPTDEGTEMKKVEGAEDLDPEGDEEE